MTEEEWLACPIAWHMVYTLDELGRSSRRKWRLFLCAGCRDARSELHRFYELGLSSAFDVAERYADDLASDEELVAVHERATLVEQEHRRVDGYEWEGGLLHLSALAAASATMSSERLFQRQYQPGEFDTPLFFAVATVHQAYRYQEDEDCPEVASLVREIFGNPFRPVSFNPAWRTSDVMQFATGIYEERAFDRMPILADALQDAGCDTDNILNHLRDPDATHVRGCWALDLVLGKS